MRLFDTRAVGRLLDPHEISYANSVGSGVPDAAAVSAMPQERVR